MRTFYVSEQFVASPGDLTENDTAPPNEGKKHFDWLN